MDGPSDRGASRTSHGGCAPSLIALGARGSPSFLCLLLLFAACQKGHEEVVRLLVEEANAEVNKVNGNNQTPINIAAYKGHLGVVRFLLSKGADCTIKDQWGDTPLASARAEGHAEVAALLE